MPNSSDGQVGPAVLCEGVVKRFYRYEHRTTSLREFFIRTVLRRPIHLRTAEFVLERLDLRVERGDALAIVGANGSGKSTALRLIAGIYTPSAGRIRITGRVASVIELGVGFHPELTGAENVALYASVMGLDARELAASYPRIVEFSGIGNFIDEPVKYYSSGMTARLAFSVVAAVDADVLLLDEVLTVGDEEFRGRCLEHLFAFRDRGGTLVIVSHDVDTLRQLCRRAIWLERGRVRLDGSVDDVLAAYHEQTQATTSTDG